MKKTLGATIVTVLLAMVAFLLIRGGGPSDISGDTGGTAGDDAARRESNAVEVVGAAVKPHVVAARPSATAGEQPSETEVESEPESAEERAVNAFDTLTDKWMEPSTKGVTMADVHAFAESFRSVPKDRKDECIHRALNLIPDENVMLLAGVLMDKTEDREIVETVFNDVLNRSDEVKKPILQEIFKDKTHSCWADTAWILDVTGELPQGKKEK